MSLTNHKAYKCSEKEQCLSTSVSSEGLWKTGFKVDFKANIELEQVRRKGEPIPEQDKMEVRQCLGKNKRHFFREKSKGRWN